MLALLAVLALAFSQEKPPDANQQKALIEAYFAADWMKPEGRVERRRILTELERVALVAFLRRLLDAFGTREGAWAEGLLPRASGDELDRLVGVAMAVIQEEAKGR